MSLSDWLYETRERLQTEGIRRGTVTSTNELWVGALRRVGQILDFGERVYEREWDALIVLDACRVGLLREVAHKDGGPNGTYPFLNPGFETFTSAGSQSAEWMDRNFNGGSDAEVRRTAYVTGNPFSRSLDASRFARLDEVWRYAWDDEFGGIPPGPVTDRAIAAGRETDADRLIVHYMQPHVPFRSMDGSAVDWGDPAVGFGRRRGGSAGDASVWEQLRDGQIDHEAVWAAYRDNLEWALESVETLLSNLDADRVIITADHANAMGEWWCYGHPDHVPVPAIREVPWVETTAEDTGDYEPVTEHSIEGVDEEAIDGRLAALGYK
jgi:hypothetical protein